jgi:hypothetical protein
VSVQLKVQPPRWTLPGEVYAYRTRKPGAIMGLPFLGRHWAYVGQTRNPKMRHREHLYGGGRYGRMPASWSDLKPKKYVLFRLRYCPQWMLSGVELFFILVLWPAYNHVGNKANPRRISIKRARRARIRRDVAGVLWMPVLTWMHFIWGLILFALFILWGN